VAINKREENSFESNSFVPLRVPLENDVVQGGLPLGTSRSSLLIQTKLVVLLAILC